MFDVTDTERTIFSKKNGKFTLIKVGGGETFPYLYLRYDLSGVETQSEFVFKFDEQRDEIFETFDEESCDVEYDLQWKAFMEEVTSKLN